MIRRPPRSTRPDTLFPYTTLFRSLLHRAHGETDRHMRLVRGSHIVVPRLFDHGFAYFFQLPDGRIFFALPYERDFTLIGTTDRDHGGSVDNVRPDPEEIAYLCDGANRYFRRTIAPQHVLWSYAGVRPLVDDGRSEEHTSELQSLMA